MATNTGEDPEATNAPAEAIDASLMVATRRGDCQKLKDLIIQKDATTMVVVMALSNQESNEEPSPASMHPLLAAAACRGNFEELKCLLNKGSLPSPKFYDQYVVYYPNNSNSGSLAMRPTADCIEEGTHAGSSVLEGVNVEGDTALHLVAANGHDGGDSKFRECADLIYQEDEDFLYKQNYNGDTPLHCAVRARDSQMVCHLVGLARVKNTVTDLLRKENNNKETALHEAVRVGEKEIVNNLLVEDPELARFPEEGPSPLYLAILLEKEEIAKRIYDKSKDHAPSYSGPDGQNALHVAVMRRTEMVKLLLGWNKSLASEVDCNGSTPLHFLSSRIRALRVRGTFFGCPVSRLSPWPTRPLLEANPAALYQSDKRGMFPIHVAASVGADLTVAYFIQYDPSSAGLRDRRGRTFLHTAAQKSSWKTVRFACQTPSLAWILNMQDADGNTALHLAIQAGWLQSFVSLIGNHQVHLNLANKEGQTPLDISLFNMPPGLRYNQSTKAIIHSVLYICGARYGGRRWDRITETYADRKGPDFERKEMEKLKDSTQTLCISSVLITTVTFGATFALPGGYRADDHTNGGAPTLAGRYTFDAFVIANTLAFICSVVGTIGLTFSGVPMVQLNSRIIYLNISTNFVISSLTSLTAAFLLGIYLVLAPVAYYTAVAISVMTPLVLVCISMEFCLKWAPLVRPLRRRIGVIPVVMIITRAIVGWLLWFSWPLLFIFLLPAITRKHKQHRLG